MTPDEYRAALKALGLTPSMPSYDGATVYMDREGLFYSIPDPSELSDVERKSFIDLLRARIN